MEEFNPELLKNLYIPKPDSHKGMNGKLMIIGGSHLFHAASLWSLTVASRIVDMVYYASVAENNQIVQKAKEEFRNGIVVPREKIAAYAEEADCIVIGPGLPRSAGQEPGDDDTKELTERLLRQFPEKKWVIDGGSLQVMDPELLKQLNGNVVITPHKMEFEKLFGDKQKAISNKGLDTKLIADHLSLIAKEYNCIVLLKGETDTVCSPEKCVTVSGGNAGMTKGGTGDVLAGLVAALACKNDLWLSATAGSYINKKAGESLFEKVGYYFNASDLADEIPVVMKKLLL